MLGHLDIYDDICVSLKVQNKRVHLARGAGCQMSCVLNVLHGGTKQGKAYAAAYALLTRAQVLLTHVIVPYADLTRTIFSTSPQFRLTRSNFYMQESKQ